MPVQQPIVVAFDNHRLSKHRKTSKNQGIRKKTKNVENTFFVLKKFIFVNYVQTKIIVLDYFAIPKIVFT